MGTIYGTINYTGLVIGLSLVLFTLFIRLSICQVCSEVGERFCTDELDYFCCFLSNCLLVTRIYVIFSFLHYNKFSSTLDIEF